VPFTSKVFTGIVVTLPDIRLREPTIDVDLPTVDVVWHKIP